MVSPSFLRRFFATYEATPGAMTRHRPDIQGGDWATRKAYQDDLASSWVDDQGLDVLHKALGMNQERTRHATGMYTPPGGALEINPARAAPTLGADPDQMSMAEAVRSYLDAQGAGAWHGVSPDGWSDALRVGMERPASLEEMLDAQAIGSRYGLDGVSDTGRGMTVTSFDGVDMNKRDKSALVRALDERFKAPIARGRLQSGYVGNEEAWGAPEGSGVLTRMLQERLQGPGAERLLDDPEIARRARMRFDRDAEGARAGAPIREDLQNARDITARKRLRGLLEALTEGRVALPAAAGAVGLAGSGEAER